MEIAGGPKLSRSEARRLREEAGLEEGAPKEAWDRGVELREFGVKAVKGCRLRGFEFS